MRFSEQEILEYAFERFQEGRYGEALEAFVLAYSKGYEREEILDHIYRCYMDANDTEFRKAYEKQSGKTNYGYEDCVLDFIPCHEEEYYIFDKEDKIFRGKFSVTELREKEPDSIFRSMEFSGAVWEMDWDFRQFQPCFVEAVNRRVYVICWDLKRAVSFCKVPELAEYMDSAMLFSDRKEFQEYFHENTSVYLPRVLFGTDDFEQEMERIIDEEHRYRLTPEGRNMGNVMLTIGIPTCNRGNLLLKRLESLRMMPYDAEVEIAISKNGTSLYQEEYKRASQISDARICYYDHNAFLKAADNWQYVVHMAHGKYVLLVSDEDDVVIQSLEHYFRLFKDFKQVNVVRARTQYQRGDIQKRQYGKKGLDAFEHVFLGQLYLSGLIVKKKDFIERDFARLEQFSENVFYQYYPHEWWCALLSLKGDFVEEPVTLISESDSMFEKEEKASCELENEQERMRQGFLLPQYATYEERLKQFGGMVEFLRWLMHGNEEGIKIGLSRIIMKIWWLFIIARRCDYKREMFEDYIDQFCQSAMDAIDSFDLNDEREIFLLEKLNNCCMIALNEHEKLNAEMEKSRKESV